MHQSYQNKFKVLSTIHYQKKQLFSGIYNDTQTILLVASILLFISHSTFAQQHQTQSRLDAMLDNPVCDDYRQLWQTAGHPLSVPRP